MKNLLTCLFVFGSLFGFSQSNSVSILEKKLETKTGLEYVETAIELSEAYYRKGNYDSAVTIAKEAYASAAQNSDKEWMAISLNRQAKALIQLPKSKRANRAEAIANLEQSLKLSSDEELTLDNLQQLRQIAMIRGKRKEVTDLEERIAALTNDEKPNPIVAEEEPEEKDGVFNGRRNALKKAAVAVAENEELNEQVEALEREKKNLRKQQSRLKYLLKDKEDKIQNMTEEQMAQELMFLEQERMLDSIVFRGRLDSLVIVQKEMKLQSQAATLAEQNALIQLKNSQRNLLIALASIILIIAFGLYQRFKGIKAYNQILEEKNDIIKVEKQRSEELLLNILPAAIAEELKDQGSAKTQFYNQATVLFTDFQNFSKISKELSPQQLVSDLDYCFKKFDKIVEKYGLEKIKTIGDAYMCAGGLPKSKNGHVYDVINAAMEMQDFLMNWKLEKVARKEPYFEARLGIHTGPIIAGVVGLKKFAYDIWGDTVNVASRMESSGETGKVNISDTTYQLVKDRFNCEYRGKVPAKNVGDIDMYFVEDKVA